jgi:hypothetical protein
MSSTHHRLRRLGASLSCAILLSGGLAVAASTAGAASSVDAPICPAATANGKFVRFLYLQIMMRCPDAAGGAYWTAKLDHGSARSAVADALDMSTENLVDNNVVPIYQQALHRAPSSTELAAGIGSIRSTHGDAVLIAKLASSDEFFANFSAAPNPEEAWLGTVYNIVLDRDTDAAGGDFFLSQLGSDSSAGMRNWVTMTLEHSPENAAGWTGAAMGAAFGREPDQAGMAYWMNWLQNSGKWQTFRMWTAMLSSQEGFNLAQTQPNPPPPEDAPSVAAPLGGR